jgi:hypothetical protein
MSFHRFDLPRAAALQSARNMRHGGRIRAVPTYGVSHFCHDAAGIFDRVGAACMAKAQSKSRKAGGTGKGRQKGTGHGLQSGRAGSKAAAKKRKSH